MRTYSSPALAAIAAGAFLSVGAVNIVCSPTPFRVWGGYGSITLNGDAYDGIGDRGLVNVTAAALGGTEQAAKLTLSGVEPDVAAMIAATSLRRAAVVLWRLIYDTSGTSLLDASIYSQGRLDLISIQEQAGGSSTVIATVEGAARGLGGSGGRIRADQDQRLIASNDGGFKHVSYAGQKTLYWAGRPPTQAQNAFAANPPGWDPYAPGGSPSALTGF